MASLFLSLDGLEVEARDDGIMVKAVFIILRDFAGDETFRNKWGGKN